SVTTVSYALNGSKEIPEATRKKILKAAEELNYVPSAYASGLKRKKSFNIGVFIPDFDGPIHHTVLSGLASGFKEYDARYNMLVMIPDSNLSMIRSRMVDLAIIMDPKLDISLIKDIAQVMPIIVLDKFVHGENIYMADVNNEEGMFNQTMKLLNLGCKRIAYLLGPKASYHNSTRFNGYKRALATSGVSFDEDIVFDANSFTEEKGYQEIKEILKTNGLKFDALMCGNDELAIGAIKALQEAGYAVPKDVKVTGFDNIDKASFISPSLSTISVDWYGYGKRVAKYAIDVINKENVEESLYVNSANVIERESTLEK
ncbi:MAG: LacI family DNA-binding transcriptional regulator, partial [Bacilli bacterium]|nr:LacI family DNA-binding transcriptional regulator [Bacilli bacterium]